MRRIVLVLGAVVSILVIPQPAYTSDVWSTPRNIYSLYPHSEGMTFRVSGPQINVGSACEVNRMVIPLANPNYDALISTMLIAYTSNEQLAVNYDDTTITGCETLVTRLMLTK